MPVGGAYCPADLTEPHWCGLATQAGLDPDMVCQEAFTIIAAVTERYETQFAGAGTDTHRIALIGKRVRLLRRVLP
ncbi:MAG: hypothetical protein LBV00_00600 [Propionibacteriaceae bacterium]|nr:hypothetical protein [Propionibacteriaceae bacterium]